MKVFILGCNNTIGHVVALYFKEKGHEVMGYDQENLGLVRQVTGNYHDVVLIQQTIEQYCPEAVINCIAVVNQDAEADKAEAAYVNCYLPHCLEKITAGTSIVVVHRSTDCIFSGERGQYTVNDVPDAKSFYARTKAVGELINDKDITIRVSLIGPSLKEDDGSLLSWFLRQQGQVNGFANAIWTGVTTEEYAREIELLLTQGKHGIFQSTPTLSISKYELLKLFEKHFPHGREVLRIDNQRVDKSLVQDFGDADIVVPSYDKMVADVRRWVQSHRELYPKYYND